MLIYRFLYSRSFSRDYRWMLVPPFATSDEFAKLYDLYRIYDHIKGAKFFAVRTPIFFIKFNSGFYLFRFGPTSKRDEYRRPIYAMQGVNIPGDQAEQLKVLMPTLLRNIVQFLDVYSGYTSRSADELTRVPSERFELPEENIQGTGLGETGDAFPPVSRFSFDEAGFRGIETYFNSPGARLVEFVYGAMPAVSTIFPDVALVAPIARHNSEPRR